MLFLLSVILSLFLFSRARFRNRRTIFNSPHPRLMHIKLGKRKKSSVRTQHLPPPPHMVPRHHSFSGHHSPFPVARGKSFSPNIKNTTSNALKDKNTKYPVLGFQFLKVEAGDLYMMSGISLFY